MLHEWRRQLRWRPIMRPMSRDWTMNLNTVPEGSDATCRNAGPGRAPDPFLQRLSHGWRRVQLGNRSPKKESKFEKKVKWPILPL
eukprot:3684526-Amphidinium_carterae.1